MENGSKSDPLEAVGAVITALGFVAVFLTGSYGLLVAPLIVGLGLTVWKMGEMRRELREEISSLKAELDELKGRVSNG
ncbi:hypothetical protein [Thermococcus sp.]|uniref:hypothetical protein n=1 Tax=Thermococcus sp. TaxID=35749 RepID=UPI00260F74EA|nr:hypothetical protein [Thermococcus sp.]